MLSFGSYGWYGLEMLNNCWMCFVLSCYFRLNVILPLIQHVQLWISDLLHFRSVLVLLHIVAQQRQCYLPKFDFLQERKCFWNMHVPLHVFVVAFGMYTEEGKIITVCRLILEEEKKCTCSWTKRVAGSESSSLPQNETSENSHIFTWIKQFLIIVSAYGTVDKVVMFGNHLKYLRCEHRIVM